MEQQTLEEKAKAFVASKMQRHCFYPLYSEYMVYAYCVIVTQGNRDFPKPARVPTAKAEQLVWSDIAKAIYPK